MPYSQQEWSRPDIHTSGPAPAALPQACSNQTHFLPTRRVPSRCRGCAAYRRVAAQHDAVIHHVHGYNCGRPFTWLISPNVAKSGAAQTAR